jgi:hypothetical protein
MSNITISVPASPLTGTVQFAATVAARITPTKVEFYADGVLKSSDVASPYAYTWDTTAYADGLHNLTAKVYYGSNQVDYDQQTVSTFNSPVEAPPPLVQAPPVNTTAPALSGVATVGETLTVSAGEWTNNPTGYTRQWVHSDNVYHLLAGATSSGYTIGSADEGKTIACVVSAYNIYGPSATVTTAATSAVSAPAPAVPEIITDPVITGTPLSGYQFITSNGSWTNSPTSYTYQWRRCNPTSFSLGESTILPTEALQTVLTAQPITLGSTATIQTLSFYIPVASGAMRLGIYADSGGYPAARKAVTAEFTPTVGWNTQVVAAPVSLTAGVYWLVFQIAQSAMRVRKSSAAGAPDSKYITATYAALPASFPAGATNSTSHFSQYATFSAVESCANIASATSSTYLLAAADVGSTVRSRVVAVNGSGSSVFAESAPSATVATPMATPPSPPPTPPPSTVTPTYVADFEAGNFSQVLSLQQSTGGRISIATGTDVLEGSYSALVRNSYPQDYPVAAGQRTEMVFGDVNQMVFGGGSLQGKETWCTWMERLASNFEITSSWCIITQFHGGTGSPVFAVEANGPSSAGVLYIVMRGGAPNAGYRQYQIAPTVPRGQTMSFKVYRLWSTSGSGRTKVWLNGALVVDDTGANLYVGGESAPYHKAGVYRSSGLTTIESRVTIDAVRWYKNDPDA